MNNVNIGNELALIIIAIKYALLKLPQNELLNKSNFNHINWQKLEKMSEGNSITAIIYHFLKNEKLNDASIQKYESFAHGIAISNLISSKNFNFINLLLEAQNINFLNYKGHLFLAELYENKYFREIGDLDILVHKNDIEKALKILVKEGYIFADVAKDSLLSMNQLIDEIPKANGMNEVTLIKTINNNNSVIDFHWGFHYGFLPYRINLDRLFENKKIAFINNTPCPCPNDYAIFTMLLIHHGGRECWRSLKYMADLLAFMETKGNDIDWSKMLVFTEEMKLKRPMLVGFLLLKQYFEYKIPQVIENEFAKENITLKLTVPILDFWEKNHNTRSLKGRLKYEKILWSIQDEGFSRWKYIKELLKMYSIPNPIESKRLITFPDNYYVLNSISKVITYLYKRTGKIIR